MTTILRILLFILTYYFSWGFEILNLKQCCDENVSVISVKFCQNGKQTNVKCNDTETLLNVEGLYEITEDSRSVYVDTYEPNSIIREPNFCVGGWNMSTYPSKKLVIVCGSPKFWSRRPKESIFDDIFVISITVLNIGSFLSLMVTAFLYHQLSVLQDSHGTCAFHFTLNWGIWHGMLVHRLMWNFKLYEPIPTFCITNVYLWGYFALTSFCWSGIMSFDTWTQSKGSYITDETKLLQRYRLCGYGIPALLIAISNIHVRLRYYSDTKRNLNFCYNHGEEIVPTYESILFVFYMTLPIILIMLTNFFFFIDSQKKFIKMYASQSKSAFKKIRYRMFINAKLFFIMGVPWFIGMLIIPFYFTINAGWWFLAPLLIIYALISSQGIFILLIMVVFRKRVLQEIAGNNVFPCMKLPEKWKTLNDSETVEESDYSPTTPKSNTENGSPFTERSFANIAREL